MAHEIEARINETATGAAFCGAVLGAVAVIAHEVYVVLFSDYPIADPFLHVMTEMAVLVPGGAMVFVAIANICKWLLPIRSE